MGVSAQNLPESLEAQTTNIVKHWDDLPKGRGHYRIRLEDAFEAHDIALLHHGGTPGVINLNSIKSAIARPYNGYYRQIWKKAAALFESVCRNHGFTDGNKRTSLLLLDLLLESSGYELNPLQGEDINDALEILAIAVADGQMNVIQIENWFRERINSRP